MLAPCPALQSWTKLVHLQGWLWLPLFEATHPEVLCHPKPEFFRSLLQTIQTSEDLQSTLPCYRMKGEF